MNPASRINAVVDAFLPLSHGDAQVTGWNRWLATINATVSDDSVLLALRAVRKELRTLEAKLIQLGVPETLYRKSLNGLTNAFQTQNLHQGWGNVHAKVTAAEVRSNLAWMAWALNRFDENDIDEEILASLIQSISDQEALLRSAEFPHGLKDLLESQIDELRIALMLYRVNGVQPIVDAVNKQSGEMRNAPEELVTAVAQAGPEAQEAVSKGMNLISKAAKVAESGSKIVKFGKDLYELGVSGYAAFGQLLLQGPPAGN
jgi:hypothetical protein